MPISNLEAAIDSPPPLIADTVSQAQKKEVPFIPHGRSNDTKTNLAKNSAPKAQNKSVLSRCTGRPSIQSFINAISSLSAQKQQQQEQNMKNFDKFSWLVQQGQHMLGRQPGQKGLPFLQQQLKSLKNPFQKQSITVNPFAQQAIPTTFENPIEPKNTNARSETKPKVRKVMKGGVLVSMPVNPRHPPEGRGVVQLARGEGGPVLDDDKKVGFSRGNILDDILARSEGNKEMGMATRKKAVTAKTEKQMYPHRADETMPTYELQKAHKIASDSSNSANLNADKIMETANAFQPRTTTKVIHASGQSKFQKGHCENDGLSRPKPNSEVKNQSKVESTAISDTNSDNQGHIKPAKLNSTLDPTITQQNPVNSLTMNPSVTISKLQNNCTFTPNICSKPNVDRPNAVKDSQLNAVVDSLTTAEGVNSFKNSSNMKYKADNNEQGSIKASKSNCTLDNEINKGINTSNTVGESGLSFIPIKENDEYVQGGLLSTSIKDNVTNFTSDVQPDPTVIGHTVSSEIVEPDNTTQPKVDIKPHDLTTTASSDELTVNIDHENETMNENGWTNSPQINKQSDVNVRKPDNEQSGLKSSLEHGDKCKDDDANQFKMDINYDLQSANSCHTNRECKSEDILEPAKVSPVSDLVVPIHNDPDGNRQSRSSPGQDNDMCENKNTLASNNEDECLDIKQELVPQSPCSPLGDLVIDMGSDADTTSSQRAKRQRYSSLTSESSSDALPVSSFDWIRNLNAKLAVAENMEQGIVDIKQELVPQSPCSPLGDLVIDMGSDADTTSSQRAKRQRYSSLTSESSSDALPVSSFDWIRNLNAKLAVAENMEQGIVETTNSVKLPEDGSSQTITNFVLSNRTKSSDSPENFLTTAQKQSNPVATVISNEEVDVKKKKTEDFEKMQTDNGNKDARVNENLKRKEYDNKSTQTGTRKKRKRSQKGTRDQYNGRLTRSMSHIDLNSSHRNNNESERQGASNARRSFGDRQESKRAQNRGAYLEGKQEKNGKKGGYPSRESSRRSTLPQHETRKQYGPSREERNKANNNNPRERGIHVSSGRSTRNSEQLRLASRDDDFTGRSSFETRQGDNVIIVKEVDDTPSLLSMVSGGSVLDVTVAQKELSDQLRNKVRGGKKKKKKKPTEWFLRKQRMEKERRERGYLPRERVQRELPSCLFYTAGKCAKGATCQFKHEKIKELCRHYVSHVCEKNLDGMCPKMHEDFPCMFYHGPHNHCSSGDSCKYSHAPITDEIREILKKHVIEIKEKRQTLLSSATAPDSNQDAAMNPTKESSETSIFINPVLATKSNPGSSHETNPTILGYSYNDLDAGINPNLITQSLVEPEVETPKVERLCSLSRYNAQLLSSLVDSIEKAESQSGDVPVKKDKDSSCSKGFVPGMFKER